MTDLTEPSVSALARRSRNTALVTLLGALLTLGALLYAFVQLQSLARQIELKRQEIRQLEVQAKEKQKQIDELKRRIEDLSRTESGLLEFLAAVTAGEKLHILDPSVDWPRLKSHLVAMPAGRRKQALLVALLYAWKEIPFQLGGESLGSGFDSPRFLQRVLSDVGVKFQASPGVRLSDSIMNQLQKTASPQPGDLAFFKGQVGSFGFILLSTGDEKSAPVGIGTLQKIAPLQVISLSNINTPVFPLIGYFHVRYPDE